MTTFALPEVSRPAKVKKKQVLLVANGDFAVDGQPALLGGSAGDGSEPERGHRGGGL
jgi:hypothetical protein